MQGNQVEQKVREVFLYMMHEKFGPCGGPDLYDSQKIANLYRDLSWILPRYGEIVQQTLQRESAGEDTQKAAACLAFIVDSLQQKVAPESFIFELYSRKQTFFPDFALAMDDFNGSVVTKSHDGINPLRHTCNCMLSYYEKFGFDADISLERKIVDLMAIYIHDFGKIINPKEEMHPAGSILLGAPILTALSETISGALGIDADEVRKTILFSVCFHDLSGNVDAGRVTKDDAVRLAAEWKPTEDMWSSLSNVQYCDMMCIPKLPHFLRKNNIEMLREIKLAVEELLMNESATCYTPSDDQIL